MIYLDWAATTPVKKEVLDIYQTVSLNCFGNPSSLHDEGKKAKIVLEESRKNIAELLSVKTPQIVFTSGGTESNNMSLYSLLNSPARGHIIISALEHASLKEPALKMKRFGYDVQLLNPEANGLISPEKLASSIRKDTLFIGLIHVHNETGVIQNLEELIHSIRINEKQRHIHIHSDMVQSLGKVPFKHLLKDLDSASFSAHKIQGLRGSGMLYLNKPKEMLYRGGGQEAGMRSGTENVAAIAAMEKAVETASAHETSEILRQFTALTGNNSDLKVLPEARRTFPDNYSPWIMTMSAPPVPAEILVRSLNEKGFACSTGSACSSHKKIKTEGLESMGIDRKTAYSSFRISIGPESTLQELKDFLKQLQFEITKLRPVADLSNNRKRK